MSLLPRPRRLLLVLGAVLAAALAPAAATAAQWQLAQPAPPPPPPGVPPAPFAVPLGTVSDIEFWSPNRGLMAVDGGNPVLPNGGIYRWDGRAWMLISTVCAGQARIAWAGPDEFWVVARGRPGTDSANSTTTLCRFKDGKVVASFAKTNASADKYLAMTSAACTGPSSCWFAGATFTPAADAISGAFHLHWDGTSLQRVVGVQGRAVRDLRPLADGSIAEAVSGADDAILTIPEPTPLLLHRIRPLGATPSAIEVDPFVPASGGLPANAWTLFDLDGTPDRLWAAGGVETANTNPETFSRYETGPALLAVSEAGGAFRQVDLTAVRGDASPPVRSIAAEPGTDRVWLVQRAERFGETSRMQRVDAAGQLLDDVPFPDPDDPSPLAAASVAANPAVTAVACAAPDDCWAGTAGGYLYRLTGAPEQAQDVASSFTTVQTVRPDDDGQQRFTPDAPPADVSGIDDGFEEIIPDTGAQAEEEEATPTGPRATRVRIKTLSRTRIQVQFRLTARAKVRLRAYRRIRKKERLVASAPTRTLRRGTHRVNLRVSTKRWPTKIDLRVTAP